MEFHTCAHASVVTAHFQLPISESDIANCSHILHKISCTTSLMVEVNECAVTAGTLIRATICQVNYHTLPLDCNWASVSEPHTRDIFSVYIYISSASDGHCTSKIAINISIFHLGSYTRRARN